MGKYLDENGLEILWEKSKNKFQTKLISGVNIKTINNTSLLGSGNIDTGGGSSGEQNFIIWRSTYYAPETIGTSFQIPLTVYGIYNIGGPDSKRNPQAEDIVIFSNNTYRLVMGKVTALNGSILNVTITYVSAGTFTCLEEGTLITMQDGTTKPIEEVRDGDLLLSYDFETKKHTPAVVLLKAQTSESFHSNYVIFENDITLSIDTDNSHEIWNETKQCYVSCKHELDVGDYGLDINGNKVEFLGPLDWVSSGQKKRFYNIISSNNCYYANNLLIAHDPFCKKSWLLNYGKKIHADLNEIIEADATEIKQKEYLVKDPKIAAVLLRKHGQITKLRCRMDAIKNQLSKTDYVAIKQSEGNEIDSSIIQNRSLLREEYNTIEVQRMQLEKEYDELRVQHSPLKEDVLLSTFELRSKLFRQACKRDNNAFELFKKNYCKE